MKKLLACALMVVLITCAPALAEITVPSPVEYLGEPERYQCEEEYGETYFHYDYDDSMEDAFVEYMALLIDEYGIDFDDYEYDDSLRFRWVSERDSDVFVNVLLQYRNDGGMRLTFAFVNVAVGDAPVSTGAAETGADGSGAVGSLALPDIDAFLGYPPPSMDEAADSHGWLKYYELSLDPGWQAGTEYVELLLNDPRYQFELVDFFENTTAWLYSEFYFFDYVGGEEITPAQDRYYLGGYQDYTADVYIRLQRNGKDGYSSFEIVYSSDLVMGDYGDRSSLVPQGADGSSDIDTSGGGYTTPDYAKEPCLTCRGDGDCTRCNGYGTIERYSGNGETVTSSCPDCNRSGNCRSCGGSGTRD